MMGYFITLEGIEGAGKSTNLVYVQNYFESSGHDVVVTREPGGTSIGELIRTLLLNDHDVPMCSDAELLLIFAARAQHLAEVILPALSAGKIVICDRFTDASYAYQGGGRLISSERIGILESWVQHELRPNLTLLFDIPVHDGLLRISKRSGKEDRFEKEKHAFFELVRKNYLQRAGMDRERIKIINALNDISQVKKDIRGLLDQRVLAK